MDLADGFESDWWTQQTVFPRLNVTKAAAPCGKNRFRIATPKDCLQSICKQKAVRSTVLLRKVIDDRRTMDRALVATVGSHNKSLAIADTEVQESAAPDGTVGGSAGGWNPTRRGLGEANDDTTMRAHRREAIARDPTTVATRRRNKTVPIWRLRRGGVAASATVCRTPLLTPEATPLADHFRPDTARRFAPRRRTDGVLWLHQPPQIAANLCVASERGRDPARWWRRAVQRLSWRVEHSRRSS